MPSSSKNQLREVCHPWSRWLVLFLLTLVMNLPVSAHGQMLPGVKVPPRAAAQSGLEGLLDDARKDGSTVIVIRPEDESSTATGRTSGPFSGLRAERFLNARKKIRAMLSSASTLPGNVIKTYAGVDASGSWLWLLTGFGTAFLGLSAAWLANRPLTRFVRDHFRNMYNPQPQTTADKAKYLLFRALLASLYSVTYLFVALVFALIFDQGHEPTRRVILEVVLAYVIYRLLRYAVSWNLMAHDVASHRLVNLNDKQASTMHKWWWRSAVFIVAVVAFLRTTVHLGFNSGNGEFSGNGSLTLENAQLLYVIGAALVIATLAAQVCVNWSAARQILVPRSPGAAFLRLRTTLARLVPIGFLAYGVIAFSIFVFRVALLIPGAGGVIAGPFLITYAALVVYGLALIIIQALYLRRERKLVALAQAERQRRAIEQDHIDEHAGEEMVEGPSSVTDADFEYKPAFRPFFENAALAIVITVGLGELGRVLGIPVAEEGNFWAAFLDVVLAGALCWLAYRAFNIFIDRRLEEESGNPNDTVEELGSEGGGAGASRMATLLPIMRYVMTIALFSVATMVILSTLGFDIGPIFAGAGVVGIAIGFGAQTLIRDIFSGAFFLMDDAFRKGEYVEIEGIKGVVEKISIRSFQLRHHLGALHTIPFGEIKQLTNYSRDWVLMKLPLRVTYDTDVEKVRKLVKRLGQELLDHPQVGHTFMQPLKSQGVYKMEDSAMIIRVKFMTRPGEQFITRKVVYEAIQDLFAREGIHFAHKEVTVRLADMPMDQLNEKEKKAVTAAARSVIDAEEETAATNKKPGNGR